MKSFSEPPLSIEEQQDVNRWAAAAHAMQSGVTTEMSLGMEASVEPKHLRVGVNVALVDMASVVDLLIRQGLITRADYLAAIADGMEREQAAYEARISARTGKKVTLA
jgi:hypothetical protein